MGTTQPQDSQPDATDAAALRNLIMGFRVSQLVYVAAKLGIADQLQGEPQAPGQLAHAVGADPRALHRLLRALASIGLFVETADGAFTLTPSAKLLQSDRDGSLRSVAILYGEEWVWQTYGRMLYSVQTGRPAFEETHGQSMYDYLRDHPSAQTLFNDAMTAFSAHEAAAILAGYDLSGVATIVDVGGGQGALLAALLRANPHLSGVLFDRETIIAEARPLMAAAGLTTQASCVAGDFFAQVPAGGDVYLLKSVLHNWDDAACIKILHTCRLAMADHARLLVIERVVPTGNDPSEAKLFDVNMLVMLGGQERTEREHRMLFEAAGFKLTRILPTHSPLSLIEGVPNDR